MYIDGSRLNVAISIKTLVMMGGGGPYFPPPQGFFFFFSSLLSRNLLQKMDHEWTIKHSSRCYKNTRTIFQRSENLGEYVPRRWVSVNLTFTSFWITKYIWEKETVETPYKRIPDCRKNLSITSTGKRIKEWIPSILFRENPWDISVF